MDNNPSHPSALFFVYAGNIRFGMGLNSSRNPHAEKELLTHIEKCKASNDIMWFTDWNDVNHAAIEASEIKKTEIITQLPQGCVSPSSIQDCFVEYHLYYQDGRIESFESHYEDHQFVFSKLTYALKTKESTPVSIVTGSELIGENLIGYASSAGISCFCPTNKLLLSGCPSSLGKQCMTKLSTTPKRWK